MGFYQCSFNGVTLLRSGGGGATGETKVQQKIQLAAEGLVTWGWPSDKLDGG